MKEVLLILAPTPNLLSKELPKIAGVLPIGLAYIASVLHENSYSVEILDLFNNPKRKEELIEYIKINSPRIIGISSTTENIVNAQRIAKLFKGLNPDIKIVMGGPHVTFTPEETLKSGNVDVVVRHEGEFAMLEIVNFYLKGLGSLERIKGISFLDNDGIVKNNPAGGLIGNLDELPFPYRSLFVNYDYATIHEPFITSRGCTHRCIFCSASAMGGGKYRMRSAENVIDELVYLTRRNKSNINFSDDTLTADIIRLSKFCSYIERLNLNLSWICESRVDVLTEQILGRMRKLGCYSIQFGVESGSQKILDLINKKISLEQVYGVVKKASEQNFEYIICSFIIGHPFDNEETINETINFGMKLQSDCGAEVRYHICTPYPGTYIWNHKEELGLSFTSNNYENYNYFNPVINTKHLSSEKIRNLFFTANQKIIGNIPEKVAKNYISHGEKIKHAEGN